MSRETWDCSGCGKEYEGEPASVVGPSYSSDDGLPTVLCQQCNDAEVEYPTNPQKPMTFEERVEAAGKLIVETFKKKLQEAHPGSSISMVKADEYCEVVIDNALRPLFTELTKKADGLHESLRGLTADGVVKQITIKKQQATIAELTALTDDALRVKLNEQIDAFGEKFRDVKLPGEITTVNELVLKTLSMARDLRHVVDRATIAERDKRITALKCAIDITDEQQQGIEALLKKITNEYSQMDIMAFKNHIRKQGKQITERDKEIGELRKVIDKYGAHSQKCTIRKYRPHYPSVCSCGFDAALAEQPEGEKESNDGT